MSIDKKLTFDEMITHFENKKVKFNLITKEEAKYILETSNYFYKITAYRKNFEKNNKGEYIDLDFKQLQDLATIDMRLRYIILHMCLDLEHTLKTRILADVTNNSSEDGYTISKEFLTRSNMTLSDSPFSNSNHYNYGLFSKFGDEPPIWALFEIITFGPFVRFFEFYYRRIGSPASHSDLKLLLPFAKNIRNLAAHNCPILMDIAKPNQIDPQRVSKPITTFTKKIPGLNERPRKRRLTNRKVHDLTVLFYLHFTEIESTGIKKARYDDLKELLERTKRHRETYQTNEALIAVYNYFSKLVDFMSDQV